MASEFEPEVIVSITPRWKHGAISRHERDARKSLEARFMQMAESVSTQIREGILAEQRAEAVRLTLQ